MDPFEISLLKTLGYFDVFNCPLTVEELFTYLWKGDNKLSFQQFSEEIHRLLSSDSFPLEKKDGFYFLRGRKEIVDIRGNRVWYVEKKMALARRAARLIRYVPGVKAMFVCNQMQVGVTKKSDIDVLIIIEHGFLYITRLLITVLLGVFRLRRHGKKITDRICLSFYVTNEALDFSGLRIESEDVYFAHWLSTLLPVYDGENYLKKIIEKNSWVQEFLPGAFETPAFLGGWRVEDTSFSLFFKKFGEKILHTGFGSKMEMWAKKFQTKHMQKNTGSVQHQKDNRVVVSDSILKFHENDRRGIFREEWEKRWKHLVHNS